MTEVQRDRQEQRPLCSPFLLSFALLFGVLCFVRAQLDEILASPSGHLSWSDALLCRKQISVEGLPPAATRKLQLSEEAARHTLEVLVAQGWARELQGKLARLAAAAAAPAGRAAAAAAAAAGDDASRFVCLGERTYAELKRYIDQKSEAKENCKMCNTPCVLVRETHTRAHAHPASDSREHCHRGVLLQAAHSFVLCCCCSVYVCVSVFDVRATIERFSPCSEERGQRGRLQCSTARRVRAQLVRGATQGLVPRLQLRMHVGQVQTSSWSASGSSSTSTSTTCQTHHRRRGRALTSSPTALLLTLVSAKKCSTAC